MINSADQLSHSLVICRGILKTSKGLMGLFTAIVLRSVHYVRVLLPVMVCILMVASEICISGHLQTTKL